jgi:hypothetical protein
MERALTDRSSTLSRSSAGTFSIIALVSAWTPSGVICSVSTMGTVAGGP